MDEFELFEASITALLVKCENRDVYQSTVGNSELQFKEIYYLISAHGPDGVGTSLELLLLRPENYHAHVKSSI